MSGVGMAISHSSGIAGRKGGRGGQRADELQRLYGVWALKEALKSPLRIQATDIDTHPNFPAPHYGFTLMLGVLYHLKNPYLVLEELARRSDYIFLSTRIAQLAPDRKTGYGGNPLRTLSKKTN